MQPVDPLNLWEGAPFEPEIRTRDDGSRYIHGRGAADDKGQLMTFVEACRAWKAATGTLPCRVTVLIEGEEESGGESLPGFLDAHRDELSADIALICDTGMFDAQTPAITTMLRGLLYEEVLVQRDMEKLRLLEWLEARGLVKRDQFAALLAEPMRQTFAAALLHGVSQCASQLFVVQLEDLELLEEPVNVPGTSYQYPNWQRKLAVPLELLFSEERVQSLLRAIAMERG